METGIEVCAGNCDHLCYLRDDPAFVPELDYVMEQDGKLIGQNMFMRAVIKADDGRDIPIMAMGPICITPALKRQGHFVDEAETEEFDKEFPPKEKQKLPGQIF